MSPRIMKSLAKFTAAATVLSAAALTVSTLPASAGTKIVLYGTADDTYIGCITGNHGVNEPNLFGVTAVANGCGVRVWLKGGTGWTYCVSPNQYAALPGWAQWPTVVGVSTNTAHC